MLMTKVSENTIEKEIIVITQGQFISQAKDESLLGTSAVISNGLEKPYDLDFTV